MWVARRTHKSARLYTSPKSSRIALQVSPERTVYVAVPNSDSS